MQTIGERLEEARKRKGISIREASESTKIRSDYLQRFENNNFELNLPDIYVRGFLRAYGGYLKLNTEKLLTDYAGLGFGESRENRRHQDQREIMGRLDLAETAKVASAPAPAPAAPPPAEPPLRNSPTLPRSVPTAVVTGAPSADRTKKVKLPLVIGGAVVALVVLVLVIRALFGDDATTPTPPATAATNAGPAAPATDRNLIRLIALGDVSVKVVQKSDSRTLFEGDLLKGESRAVLRSGEVLVSYNLGRNLQVEVQGLRYRMRADGQGRNSIPEAAQ